VRHHHATGHERTSCACDRRAEARSKGNHPCRPLEETAPQKRKILNFTLNENFPGQNFLTVTAALADVFHKHAGELAPHEAMAFLASLAKRRPTIILPPKRRGCCRVGTLFCVR